MATPCARVVARTTAVDHTESSLWPRDDMSVRSIIPPRIGRPTEKLPAARYRRLMKQRFARKADRKVYGQRAQSETVNSMMKRNFGDALRSELPKRRRQEMLLRTLTHDLLLWCAT